MITHSMEQRTDAWNTIRAGKITASVAAKIITPTGKPSTQAKSCIGQILAEQMGLQEPTDIPQTEWVERGVDVEDEARLWFQVETGYRVEKCGFIESEDHLSGFSPDGIIQIAADTIVSIPLELKVPKPSTHIGYLLEGELPKEYRAQCHFAMVIAEVPFMYFMSYCPGLPALVIRVERDDYTLAVEIALEKFIKELKSAKELIT